MSPNDSTRGPIHAAVFALARVQNPDGGIPAVKPGDPSGAWTTASTVESILFARVVEAVGVKALCRMVEFLLETKLTSDGSGADATPYGRGWPLIKGGRASTMATAHAVAALSAACKVLDHDAYLHERTRISVEDGYRWLVSHQNPDGGWGAEPGAGSDGDRSRVISTYYAIHGLVAVGETYQMAHSMSVRKACGWLVHAYVPAKGWGLYPGQPCDPDSTARAISALCQAGEPNFRGPFENEAFEALLSGRSDNGYWPIAVEGMLQGDASGAIIFNSNTNVDALVAILDSSMPGKHEQTVHELLAWLLRTQDPPTGFWRLQSPTQVDPAVVTWSTAEWLHGVAAARSFVVSNLSLQRAPKRRRPDRYHVFLGLAVIALVAWLLDIPAITRSVWSDLAPSYRGAVVALLGAVAIGVITEVVLSPLRSLGRSIRRRLQVRQATSQAHDD